ncbi:MAG TPA: isochorismatase family cysteine hydrolase [Nocardioides sp.]|uniref:cysteine hydrolase family protein n=1 Tax=Nocardioides sp. TaxID=35761 RepID=UPI002E33C0F2|nr:isochorismatase family cysteine hydrolase [Nocardioides sp.]HEX5087622.1 isochorismatase family cysteine hydrolase [Nocardioides sp.]
MTTALLVIDLQNDYFADAELARCKADVLAASNLLVRAARAAGALVVEAQTVHARDRSTWALNMLDDDQGMAIEGTEGARRLDGLLEPDLCIVKTRDSAFYDTPLESRLRERGVDRLVLAGVSTESCIAATATDAYARDLRVVLVDDATASVEWRLHDETLARLQRQYRQAVVPARRVRFD